MIASLVMASLITQAPQPLIPFADIKKWWTVSKAPKWEDYKGKVVIVHFYPSFCCGFDVSVKHIREALDKWPGKVAAVSVVYGILANDSGKKEFDESIKNIKVDWPVGLDPDDKFSGKFYPNDSPKYTYAIIDRKGNRMPDVVPTIDQLPKYVEKALARS